MSKEYVIWGKSEKSGHEDAVLVSDAGSPERAEKLMRVLAEQHGCYSMRVQVLDLSQPLDFAGAAGLKGRRS